MKTTLYLGLLVLTAGVFYLMGSLNSEVVYVESLEITPSQERIDFEFAAESLPRGGLDIPAQWFIMDGMAGEEKMMFIFGYADNRSVCEHTLELAREEAPWREFRCEDAN
ncbi:MAG TPA: hypothetical protein VKP88_08545 [Candidatus Paceibacterota bacterium]|nr:hypothetical protein [Candidatus Paceibacterota bacterium]